jgi:hypothetical protein
MKYFRSAAASFLVVEQPRMRASNDGGDNGYQIEFFASIAGDAAKARIRSGASAIWPDVDTLELIAKTNRHDSNQIITPPTPSAPDINSERTPQWPPPLVFSQASER